MRIKEADGERQAAQAMYEAKLRLAEADSQSASKRAEGEKSLKMVDVNVEREKVGVEKASVDVERVSLANKQEFEGAALQFELDKLRIQADKEVRIAAAQAMAGMFAKAQMQIFGDPGTMANMSQQFMKAAGYGAAADGLMHTLPAEAKTLLTDATKLNPDPAEAFYLLGRVYEHDGDAGHAAECYRKAFELSTEGKPMNP